MGEYTKGFDKKINIIKSNEEYIKNLEEEIRTMNYNDAEAFLLKVIKFSKDNNLKVAYSWAIFYLAKIYCKESKYEEADLLLMKAYELFYNNKDINGILSSIAGLISSKLMLHDYKSAIEWSIKGVEIAEAYNNMDRLAAIKGNMSTIYIEIEEYKKAIEILDELESISWVGSKINKVILIMNRIICEVREGNINKALKYLNDIKEAVETIPDFNMVWKKEMAIIHIYKGEYKKAEDMLTYVIEKCQEFGMNDLKNQAIIALSEIKLIKKQYIDVIEDLKNIENEVYKAKFMTEIKMLCYNLNLAYKNIEDYKNSYIHYEKAIEIERKISKIQKDTTIRVLDKQKEKLSEKNYKILYEQDRKLYEVGRSITANLNTNSIFKVIAEQIKNFIEYNVIQIALYNDKEDNYKYELFIIDDKIIDVENILVDEISIASYSIKNKEDVLISNVEEEYYKYIKDDNKYLEIQQIRNKDIKNKVNIKSAMFIPMIIKDNVKGVISIQSYKSAAYNIEDLITFKILSSYITIALENSILYRKVEYNANYDGLTSIYNRRRAIEKINKLREKLNNNEEFYVAMIDIDNFKEVNDIYGHNMGDKVLIEVAKVLKDSIKKDDILGRYGGEEFILLMKNNNGEIIKDIERIRENIEKLTIKDINNNVMNVTVSIGVEVFDKKYNTLEANISLADKKLYEAKNTGKNKVVF